jgi:hypothetical protein
MSASEEFAVLRPACETAEMGTKRAFHPWKWAAVLRRVDASIPATRQFNDVAELKYLFYLSRWRQAGLGVCLAATLYFCVEAVPSKWVGLAAWVVLWEFIFFEMASVTR